MEVLKPPPNGASSSGEDPLALYDAERPVPAGRPWLLANMVAGLDGSLAWHGRVGSLSSPTDRDLFLRLRAVADGVLVGASTVREEGYGPVRLPEERRARRGGRGAPPIVVVTRSLALDWEAPLFTEPGDARTVVVTCASAPADAAERAREVAEVVVAGEERVDPVAAMAELRARGMEVLLTEGGPTLLAELVDHALLDELCLTLTPYLGGDPLTMAHRPEAARGLVPFALASVLHHEGELFLRYLASGAEGEAS